MNIVLLGLPGSGKGTQAEKIVEKLGVYYFEAGKFARNLAKTNPEIKRLIDNGKLIPQEKMTKYVQDFLEKNVPEKSDILFEGYPRFIGQYLFLKKWLAQRGKKIDKVIMLDVDKEEVIKRLSARRMCEDDGKIYNLITNPPEKGDCKGRLIQREDDRPEVIKKRFEEYEENVMPLIRYIEKEGKLIHVDGARPIDKVTKDIFKKLGV